MTIKTIGIDNDIKITDQIRFVLSTTKSAECLNGIQSLFTPYKINQVTIYYISKDFVDTTVSTYTGEIYDNNLLKKYEQQKTITCELPTSENLKKLNLIKYELEQSKKTSSYFFKEAVPIKVFGGYVNESGELFPAWINPDMVPIQEKEKVQRDNLLQLESTGKFILEWNPLGCREGDYFICWNWTPNLAGSSQSAHMSFRLLGDSRLTNSIPTHYTIKNKYETLLDRYLPDMFKNFISDGDLTPMIMQELNMSVAKGFTFVEDMANQIIDLLDSNTIAEQLLPLLSNTFNLRLKSYDPILWRRQIKKAIPNFKAKGTLGGLKSALGDAGMKFLKITKLWQISSKYTYQEHFEITNSLNFKLSKNIILPIDQENFSLHYRLKDSKNWILADADHISVTQSDTESFISWITVVGEETIDLKKGDSIKILYQFKEIPNLDAQYIENHIRSLDLMDKRDERDQSYPLKNWNTKLIEEDDPLFDRIIPIRHPIQDSIIWGKIRTEFPYSENVYNMEEYNGSTRDSLNPCDIGKEFIDPCSYCQSSKINLDVEIENLSNDRVIECHKLIEEFVPFHSPIHSVNFLGCVNDFVKSPIEEITSLVSVFGEETMISGEAQHIFNRSISRRELSPSGYQGWANIKREMLSQMEEVEPTVVKSGLGYNRNITLFCPSLSEKEDLENENFANKTNRPYNTNIDVSNLSGSPLQNSNLLEILSSDNQGLYSVRKINSKSFNIITEINEPIDKSQFEFRISNKVYEQTGIKIDKDNLYKFKCGVEFYKSNIKTKEDSETDYWKVKINESGYGSYGILKILSDNTLVLEGPMPDNEVNNLNWEILDGDDESQITGSDGEIKINLRGLVDLDHISCPVDDIRDHINIGDYLFYDDEQYKIESFVDEHKFYIENFQDSIGSNEEIAIYRRIIENCIGQLDYSGFALDTTTSYSSQISESKENYLILIDSQYYFILGLDGDTLFLEGSRPTSDWTVEGQNVNYSIYKFINQQLVIAENIYPPRPGHTFAGGVNVATGEVIGYGVKRSDNEIITKNIETQGSYMSSLASKILNSINSGNQVIDTSAQDEKINVVIEYEDGKREEKNI
jgi:P2-related tail formation protein